MPTNQRNKANRLKKRPEKVEAYGNQDKDKEYKITQDVIDNGMYVLLHYKHHNYPDPNNPMKRIDSGDVDSSSKRIGVYTQATYDEFTREDEAAGKVNTFHKMHGKYIVLHDPTIEQDDIDDDDYDFDNHSGYDNSTVDNSQKPAPLTKEQLLDLLKALQGSEDDHDSDSEQIEDNESDDSEDDELSDDLAGMTKAELLERLNGLSATDEELKLAATHTTKKADIISLIEKYETQ